MFLQPKPEIANLETCAHGGINYAELKAAGIAPETILDFSVCTNPFMPPPGIREILTNVSINQYPDSDSTEFRQKLSEKLGVPIDNIIAGSGTMELIRLIALTYFRAGDTVLIVEPTFGEYEVACQIVGVRLIKQWTGVETDFIPQIEETTRLIEKHHPRAVFICNPSSPAGKYLYRQDIQKVLYVLGEDGLLILDEAYISFVEKGWASTALLPRNNLIILRSMTKDFGLAGLRLGYALANHEIISYLRAVCPPWNVNAVAQKVGFACLGKTDYLEWSLGQIKEAKKFLVDELTKLGFRLLPSDAHYFLIKVESAKTFRSALLKKGILVRDCTSFGLPKYVRISPRTMPECQKLIDTICLLKQAGLI